MKRTLKNKMTDKEKLKVIDDFCKHIEDGHTEYSFIEYDFRDIEEYAFYLDDKKGNTLQVDKIKKSLRKSFLIWEDILFEIKNDVKKKYLIPLWIFYMKSRYSFGVEEYKKSKPKNNKIDIKLSTESNIKEIEK
jgi:hypothetical protein